MIVKTRTTRNLSILAAATALLGLLGVLIFTHPTSAISATSFTPGRIIDDAVFTNSNSMNPSQIQAFLNSKVTTCDTWGTQPSEYGGGTRAQWGAANGVPAPYVCLRNYVENNKSAAQIIYEAGQFYRINPQVLIVLLQKEQGLVTDAWPLPKQFQKATGYGCPDTAPCNTLYYGFTNQVHLAAKMFRAIMNDSPERYNPYVLGNNYIRWNPNAACGGTVVNIQNRATQALYNYTPYQPNQAALNAGYGTGDSCSAYGNRNFYLYFNDWFGNSHYVFGAIPANSTSYSKAACTIPIYDDSNIGRLYNPDTRDFLYTSNRNEACVAVSYGYIWDDVVMKNATGSDAIPVYRIANAERHIYTSSPDVRTTYLNNFGYKDEGIGFYVYGSNGPNRTPVQGLQLDETFFITSSGREALYYQDSYGFYNFGTMYYTDKLSLSPTPVYRITRNNSRLYTTSSIERSSAIANYGFSDEGVVSLNDLGPNDGNLPLYRVRSPSGSYVYTTNRVERDIAVINYQHYSEGIAFYSLLWSNAPVYRATNYANLMRIYTPSSTEYNNASASYGYKLEGVSWYGY